jgi:hypothetical protein
MNADGGTFSTSNGTNGNIRTGYHVTPGKDPGHIGGTGFVIDLKSVPPGKF